MLGAYLVCAAVRPDPTLVGDGSTVVILDEEDDEQPDPPAAATDEQPELLVIPLIVVAGEPDQVLAHSRRYLQMLALDTRRLVLASSQGAVPMDDDRLTTPPDGLVGRFDTVVALHSSDDAAFREACHFLRSLFSPEPEALREPPPAADP